MGVPVPTLTTEKQPEEIVWAQRGYALVTSAIVLVLLAGVMGFFLAGTNIRENENSASSLLHMKAYYLALSGIDWMVHWIAVNEPKDTLLSFGDGSIELKSAYQGANNFSITSTGRVGEFRKKLNVGLQLVQYSFFPDTSLVDRALRSPVVIDTIWMSYPYYNETFISSQRSTTNFWSDPYRYVGWRNSAFGESRALIHFDLSRVQFRSGVDTAIFYYNKVPTFPPKTQNIGIYRVTSAWIDREATWVNKTATSAWNQSGGDFDPDPISVTNVLAGGWISWDVTQNIRDALDGNIPYYGWLLRDPSPLVHYYSQFSRPIPPRLLITFAGEPGLLMIEENQVINGNFFVRDSVYVVNSANIGQAPGASTRIWVTAADTVYGYSNWAAGFEYPVLKINYPTIEDTINLLNSVAAGISSYSGNKFLVFTSPKTLNLSNFDNSTIFVKDSIIFNGATVLSEEYDTPGIIVSNSFVKITNSTIGANVVILARGDVTVSNSQFGVDYRAPNEKTVALIWSTEGDIRILDNSTVYSNVLAYSGNAVLESTLYGGLFVRDTMSYRGPNVYHEGAFWLGKVANNTLNTGPINITGDYPDIFVDLPRVMKIGRNIRD